MRSMTWIPLRASGAASAGLCGTAVSSWERDFGYYSKSLRRPPAINRNDIRSVAMARVRVALFVTCLVDLMRPRIGFAALKLLETAGCEVIVPETQTCCGQPAWNSGDAPGAVALAKKTIAEFEGFEYLVTPSGSCGDHIRNEYPGLFAAEPDWRDRATALASRTYELTDFLVTVLKVDSVPGDYEGTVTYHDSC